MRSAEIVGWVRVAAVAELARRRRLRVEVDGAGVALFLIDDAVYALRDECVHKQRLLSNGTVLNGQIICPGHQWAFDPASGQAEDQDDVQPAYPVRIEDGAVYLDASAVRCEVDVTAAPR